ncbi:MAG: CPBP family intramembrane glutamic endopeptidase [Sedimentibacter sp.]|uniref:CPBP family intramembrane glutamic endopeptidase n=1 Tax=Sedimentibacter sp. TaxID=1960295 RepID=UPI003158F116
MNYQFMKIKKIFIAAETLIVFLISFGVVVFAPYLLRQIKSGLLIISIRPMLYVVLAVVPIIAGKITGYSMEPVIFKKENLKGQAIAGLKIFASTAVVLTLASLLSGENRRFLIGPKVVNMYQFIYNTLFFMLFVGTGEEILFRGYFLERFYFLCGSKAWSVILSSATFGLWHFPGGQDFMQVILTALLGAYYGFSYYRVKDCSVMSLAMAHGLYDIFIMVLGRILL